ncbi:MAG: prepilin-type N-terminal cleavage/methylation domain-containing protein [Candidatus Omnitrophica bacterium]|nr:prepilin-type N-terminal cleavage/methylation domain-containing protein [Candidatus Omnitrophota bacterium]
MKINKFGLTLIEALVSIAIFTVVVGVIYLFFMVGIGSWELGSARTDLQAQARSAVDIMVAELKNVNRGNPSRGITILPAPNNDKITFYLPDIDINGAVIIGAGGDIQWPVDDAEYIEYKYLLNSKQLVREDKAVRDGITEAGVIANEVSGISFIDAGIDGSLYADEVNIVLNLEKTNLRGRTLSFSMRAAVKLRN